MECAPDAKWSSLAPVLELGPRVKVEMAYLFLWQQPHLHCQQYAQNGTLGVDLCVSSTICAVY